MSSKLHHFMPMTTLFEYLTQASIDQVAQFKPAFQIAWMMGNGIDGNDETDGNLTDWIINAINAWASENDHHLTEDEQYKIAEVIGAMRKVTLKEYLELTQGRFDDDDNVAGQVTSGTIVIQKHNGAGQNINGDKVMGTDYTL